MPCDLTVALNSSLWPQVLWAEERAERNLADPQSFVDLGCGNGLLVHILTNEGVRWDSRAPGKSANRKNVKLS